jgi:predicted nucleotidyltransferase component of viral defense system
MHEFRSFDALAVFIINHFSTVFRNHAILKGGMVLRLLGSERNTNDIDYTFIPYTSKKEVNSQIQTELDKLFPGSVTSDMHSQCIRFYVNISQINIQIEVNVDEECQSIDLSTYELAKENNQLAYMIRVMDYATALAHKCAAWNERSLYRDLYDAYFLFTVLEERPSIEVLKKRLASVKEFSKNKKISMTLEDFLQKFNNEVASLNQDKLENELQDYLPQIQLAGLDKKLKIGLIGLAEYIEENI